MNTKDVDNFVRWCRKGWHNHPPLNPWYIIVWRCLWLIPVQLFRLGFCLCILFSMGWSEFKRACDDTR